MILCVYSPMRGRAASPGSGGTGRASAMAHREKLQSFTQKQPSSTISLDPGLHLTEGFPFSLLFFATSMSLVMPKPGHSSYPAPFPSLSALQPVSPLSWPFQATWTSGYRSASQGLVSLILIFLFHSKDLPALTRRQITNFRG